MALAKATRNTAGNVNAVGKELNRRKGGKVVMWIALGLLVLVLLLPIIASLPFSRRR